MKKMFIFGAIVSLCGCVSSGYIPASDGSIRDGHAILIVGYSGNDLPFRGLVNGDFSPEIILTKVEYNGEAFYSNSTYRAKVIDGYAIFDLEVMPEGENFMVYGYIGSAISSWVLQFWCDGKDAEMLPIKPGDVVDAGTFLLGDGFSGHRYKKWTVKFVRDIDSTKSYLGSSHPELAQRLKTPDSSMESIDFDVSCN